MAYLFPFGQELHPLVQQDRSPKKVFVLGVYASAVHARWKKDGQIICQALAVARNHRFPSTLCEMSFISYPEEFQWTITEGNFARSAKALADGVIEFYSRQAKYISY